MSFLKNKKIILSILVFIGIIAIKQDVFANTANISISPSSPRVGDAVTVTVTVSNVNTATVTANVSGVVSGTIKVVGGDMEGNLGTFSKSQTFTAQSAGQINVSVSGSCVINGTKENTGGSASATVSPKPTPTPTPNPTANPTNTPTTPTPTPVPTRIPSESNGNNNNDNNEPKSSNNHLKSLSVNVGKLKPAFNRDNTNYTVEFDEDFDLKGLKSIKVSGEKENDKASVTGLGEKALEEGENTISIEVKAENGSVRTYNIKVVKPTTLKQSDLRIKSLVVNKINKDNNFIKATLNEEFSPDKFEYTLDVDKNIIGLDITPNLENNDIIVNIEGINNLEPGENIVKITLTSKDDANVKTVYTIKVNKEKEPEEVVTTDGKVEKKEPLAFLKGPKGILTIVIGIIVILVIALVTLMIIDNKNKKKMQAEDNEYPKKDTKSKEEYNVFKDKEVKSKKTKEAEKDNDKTTKGRGKRFN